MGGTPLIVRKTLWNWMPFKLNAIKKVILDTLNSIPPYYIGYTGRDRSVPEKESVLQPKFPLDRDA